jgi:5'(3')-deoxyribonucleotidase
MQSSGHVKIFCSQQYQVCEAVKKIRGNIGQLRKYRGGVAMYHVIHRRNRNYFAKTVVTIWSS